MGKRLFSAMALVAVMAGGATSAHAGLIFTVDGAASSVSISSAADGVLCSITSCGVSASLAPGLDGTTFSLDTGDSHSFDFLQFTGSSSGGTVLDVTATLAFSQPAGANTTGNGIGAAFLLSGQIISGALTWTNLPTQFLLPQGSTIGVDFEGGLALLAGRSVTTGATVSGVNIVPTPGTLSLLGAGLILLGVFQRRRRAA